MRALFAASVVVLVGLTGAYVLAWRLHRFQAFLLVACAWCANLLYLTGEFALDVGGWVGPEKLPYVLLLSVPVPALIILARDKLEETGTPQLIERWVAGSLLAGASAVAFFLEVDSGDHRWYLVAAALSAVHAWAFASFAYRTAKLSSEELLLAMGAFKQWAPYGQPGPPDQAASKEEASGPLEPHPTERSQLRSTVAPEHRSAIRSAGAGKFLIALGFFVYATIQVAYPFRFDVTREMLLTCFSLGLTAKVLIGLGMGFLVLADFRAVAESARLATVTRELAALTSSVDHDVRPPLSILLGTIRNLKLKYQADSSLMAELDKLRTQLDRITSALDIIPELRESEEFVRKRFRRWNLYEIVRTAVTELKKMPQAAGVRVVSLEKGREVPILANRDRLVRVFFNLLTNCVEAYEARGITPRRIIIGYDFDKGVGLVTVRVRDEAGGIDRELVRRITEPMVSSKHEETKRNSGMGLFTAERYVKQHGGELTFATDSETYTEMMVTLPTA